MKIFHTKIKHLWPPKFCPNWKYYYALYMWIIKNKLLAYPAFNDIGQHDDVRTSLLPHHFPEIINCVFCRTFDEKNFIFYHHSSRHVLLFIDIYCPLWWKVQCPFWVFIDTFILISLNISLTCKIQKNWCTVTVASTIEHHGGHSRTPANQRWDQVPGRSQRLLLG